MIAWTLIPPPIASPVVRTSCFFGASSPISAARRSWSRTSLSTIRHRSLVPSTIPRSRLSTCSAFRMLASSSATTLSAGFAAFSDHPASTSAMSAATPRRSVPSASAITPGRSCRRSIASNWSSLRSISAARTTCRSFAARSTSDGMGRCGGSSGGASGASGGHGSSSRGGHGSS